MNAEILVATLWVVVAAYWLWTRRPTGDPIRSFRRELHVLQTATPARVAPANRLCPTSGPLADLGAVLAAPCGPSPATGGPRAVAAPIFSSKPEAVKAAALAERRAGMRRRRQTVLVALVALVVLSLAAAVVVGGTAVLGVQVLCDMALAGFVVLLLSARPVPGVPVAKVVVPEAPRLVLAPAPVPEPAPRHAERTMDRQRTLDRQRAAQQRGAHAMPPARPALWPVLAGNAEEIEEEPYGDFGSYASLALARAN